jgi:hypothetical protein
VFSALCSFLYILDMTEFPLQVVGEMMYKKRTFYTYDTPHKKSPLCEKYGKPTPNEQNKKHPLLIP